MEQLTYASHSLTLEPQPYYDKSHNESVKCICRLLEAGSDPFITDPNTHHGYKFYMEYMLNEESPVHLHIQSALLL